MKKSVLQVFLFNFYFLSSFGQNPGEWVWLHGSNTANSSAVFGTQGIPDPANMPPAVYEPCEWTDLNGNFWLYGGYTTTGYSADLWKYDPITNQWAWMKGPGTTSYPGIYGTQGVSSPTNNPPSKSYGATSWVDKQGNFWLFGGYSTLSNSDLWKYDPLLNEWTWMKGPNTGNQPGIYGTRGFSNAANTPGARWECAAAWTDKTNNLWLFGGYNSFNDLWRYDISINEWTWMKGSNTINQSGIYGTLGIEDSSNTPGARGAYSHWKDNTGNFWLFAGMANNPFNDLWRYNPVNNNWTWMGGSNVSGAPGVYGKKCVTSSANIPGQRFENRAYWTDRNGNFWMFGGVVGGSAQYAWNDLWMYCVAANQWIWMNGDTTSNQAANWGAKGVSAPANKPNGRGGAVGWTDGKGHLYLFGGITSPAYTRYNDMWMFTIDSACGTCSTSALPTANFVASDTNICAEGNNCVNFSDFSGGNPTSWLWHFTGGYPDTSSQQNPINICYSQPGTYPVTLIVTNSSGTDSLTVSPMITVGGTPPPPTITTVGNTLYSSHGSSYQWFLNGSPIAGATDSFYVSTQPGTYSVRIIDVNGCNALSNGFPVAVQELSDGGGIEIYPNPANQTLVISGLTPGPSPKERGVGATIEIHNILGEAVFSPLLWRGVGGEADISALSNGVYFLKVECGGRMVNKKFVVVHD